MYADDFCLVRNVEIHGILPLRLPSPLRRAHYTQDFFKKNSNIISDIQDNEK